MNAPGARPGVPVRRWIGRWILVAAALHVLLGVASAGAPLAGLFASGWAGMAQAAAGQRIAFWFVGAGLLLALVGLTVDAIERDGARLPRMGGIVLLAWALAGAVLDPASGFWLLLPPAIGWILGSRR